MKRKRILGFAVLCGVSFAVMIVLAMESPGWAAPSQLPDRQTVPDPALTPRVYLPLVVRESTTPMQAGRLASEDSVSEVRSLEPGFLLPDVFPPFRADAEKFTPLDSSRSIAWRRSATESYGDSTDMTAAYASSLPTGLCRLGVDKSARPISDYPLADLANLRADWYFSWSTSKNPPTPNGIRFAQSVFVKQWKEDDGELVLFGVDAPYAEPYTYTFRPSASSIEEIAIANPGSLWLIGNEIERRDWPTSGGGSMGQNEILPEVYARVYHEVYGAIKSADPTAKVANGSIIVPTPLRLDYMSRVWDEYIRLYDAPMPVDVWQIHVYFGPEKRGGWGIDIPAGIDADEGMFCFDDGEGDPDTCDDFERNVLVNKDFSYVPGLVRDFRLWMKERGQRNKPLLVTEFGVCMPDWIMEGEFTPEAIRDEYMYPSLEFLLNAKDPELGYPADENRLVQSAWWYSLDADHGKYEGGTFYQNMNGNLFWSGIGPPTHSDHDMGISPLGQYWIDHVSALTENVNLRPLEVIAAPAPFSANGNNVTATVRVRVSNSGNVAVTEPFTVTAYDDSGGVIGGFSVDTLEGCGNVAEGIVTWPDLEPGTHPIRVRVDSSNQIIETDEADNEKASTVLVASFQAYLPAVSRRGH